MTESTYRCQNCNWHTTNENEVPEHKHLMRLIACMGPGDVLPDGQCPDCGAVVMEDKEPAFLIDPEMMEDLRQIKTRLYEGTGLTFDQRRAIAARLGRVIDAAVPVN